MGYYELTYVCRDADNSKEIATVLLADDLPVEKTVTLCDLIARTSPDAELPNSFLPGTVGLDSIGAGAHELVSLVYVQDHLPGAPAMSMTQLLAALDAALAAGKQRPEKYYRAVATVEVPSSVPLDTIPLDALHGAVKRGIATACTTWSPRRELNAAQVRAMLPMLGKSPDFFDKDRKSPDA